MAAAAQRHKKASNMTSPSCKVVRNGRLDLPSEHDHKVHDVPAVPQVGALV